MLLALEKSLGVVTSAAGKIKIARGTHYNWLNSDPEYKREVESLEDFVMDFLESKAYKLVMDENVVMTIFMLKCRARRRGYGDRGDYWAPNPTTESSVIELGNGRSISL